MTHCYVIGSGASAYIAALSLASSGQKLSILDIEQKLSKPEHAHLFLAATWRALSELSPDVKNHIDSRDLIDVAKRTRFRSIIGLIPQKISSIASLGCSLTELLTILKKTAAADPLITVIQKDLDSVTEMINSGTNDLFVIASGFRSEATQTILSGLKGWKKIHAEEDHQFLYSSFTFQIPSSALPTWRMLVHDLRIDGKQGVLCSINQNGLATLSVVYAGNKAKAIRTETELWKALHPTEAKNLIPILKQSHFVSGPHYYRYRKTEWHQVEIERAWPAHVILFGDAYGHTNPYFGHGTLLACLQGLLLKKTFLAAKPEQLKSVSLSSFREQQSKLFFQVLAQQKKLGTPSKMVKVTKIQTLLPQLILRLNNVSYNKFFKKIHLLAFLEKNSLLQWSQQT